MNSASVFDGDQPVSTDGVDRLGLRPTANKVAAAITAHHTRSGWVLGIEGRWGSGKSTLVGFIEHALVAQGVPTTDIVRFAPWLVGGRDNLLEDLFQQITRAAMQIDPNAAAPVVGTGIWSRTKAKLLRIVPGKIGDRWRKRHRLKVHNRKLRAALKRYGSAASKLGKLGPLADVAGAGGLGTTIAAVFEKGGDYLSSMQGAPPLAKQKAELTNLLQTLSRPVIVLVDDLDRLEPEELVEVLRLVRAVAEFPNIVYVLSYEPEVVARSLRKALGIAAGDRYLEKFIQSSFKVPAPAAFDLRHWFKQEASLLFSDQVAAMRNADQREINLRFASAIDSQGGQYLDTPRAVVRTLNSLRLYGVSVADLVDIADLVWLQIIRTGNKPLYDWIEMYMVAVAATADGASVDKQGKAQLFVKLKQIIRDRDLDLEKTMWQLYQVLPSIHYNVLPDRKDQEDWEILYNVSEGALRRHVDGRRLGSPQHYRIYFALVPPEGSISDSDLRKFIHAAAHTPAVANAMFASLAETIRPQGGVAANQMLDRLLAIPQEKLSKEAAKGIVFAVAAGMDTAARTSGQGPWGRYWIWASAADLFNAVMRRSDFQKDAADRIEFIKQVFKTNPSLGWLADVMSDQLVEQGYAGDRAKPISERLLSQDEFECLRQTMLERLGTEGDTILRAPQLLGLLFGWKQAGGESASKKWVAAQIETDSGLLDFLPRVRSWATINDRLYHPLNADELQEFLDVAQVRSRLDQLASEAEPDANKRALAIELQAAFKSGSSRRRSS